MKTVQVTESNFDEVLNKEGIVLLDWWAPWCGPCRSFAPTFEAAASRHPNVTFGKINTEDQPALAQDFDISAIPTLMLLRDGILLLAKPGAVSGPAIDGLIEKARALDMEQIKAELDKQESA